eukprot:1660834-Prymnesium_polylepis.2
MGCPLCLRAMWFSRHAANAGCFSANEANGSSAGSSSLWPSAATSTISCSMQSLSVLESSRLHPSSAALPASQRAGSENTYFHKVFTRSAAVIWLQESKVRRKSSSLLSAPGTLRPDRNSSAIWRLQ